ncbi:hypothetical protein ACJRO7_032054 [Eucalyptus globulus]|uniref:Uncharacterized protein n=1 Tax=Eucalyptus globulus TaxID=34317 RepID=A0ABD3JSF3_EUCGL
MAGESGEGDVDNFIEAPGKYSAEERGPLVRDYKRTGPFWEIVPPHRSRHQEWLIRDMRRTTKANFQGDTALHVAARAGKIHTAKLLLDSDGIVGMANNAGNTALHEAVKNSHYELTRMLLNRGSNLVYEENRERKCPLYLAVEMGDLRSLVLLMEAVDGEKVSLLEGMSPVHGAVMHERIEMLKEMSKQKKELFYLIDVGGGTPLHLAAYANYIDGVKFLVNEFTSSAVEYDKEGYLPIHIACKMGHLETIKELIQHWPFPEELLNFKEGQNILHVAAKYGRASIVKYILGNLELEKLINVKDKEGNTPLHLATLQWQPEVLLSLTRDNRVDLKLVNNGNLTALDIVDEQLKKVDAPLQQINDSHAVLHALEKARQPLLTALATMSMAFMAGVYVTVSKCTWIAILALIIGSTALFVILSLYVALFVPLGYNCRLVQFFADYIIRAGISISRSVTVERATWQPHYPLGILNPSAGCPEIDPIPATNVIDGNSKY